MKKIVAICNQKGGVGKTTTTISLSACVGRLNNKVLVIDLDPQGNSTSGLGVDKNNVETSIYDVLINEVPIDSIIMPTSAQNVDILPSNISLAGAEVELVSVIAREQVLKFALQKLEHDYDYIFIDCPPSLGLLTLNALTAANSLIVPIQCEYFALEGLSQLMSTLQLVNKHLNPQLEIEGVVLTMYDGRTNLSNQVVQEVKRYYNTKVYRSIIPRSIRLGEAPSYGLSIADYALQSSAGQAYMSLAQEFAGKLD